MFSGLHAAILNEERDLLFRLECMREINRVVGELKLLYQDNPEGHEKLVRVKHVIAKTKTKLYAAKNECYGW